MNCLHVSFQMFQIFTDQSKMCNDLDSILWRFTAVPSSQNKYIYRAYRLIISVECAKRKVYPKNLVTINHCQETKIYR